MEDCAEIPGLLIKHLQSELTSEELATLEAWIAQSEQNQQFFNEIDNPKALMANVRAYDEGQQIDKKAAWDKLNEQTWMAPQKKMTPQKRRYYTAAIVIGLLIIPIYLLLFAHAKKTSNVSIVTNSLQNDVSPGSNHAYLTLADGSTIVLDSANNGLLAKQGTIQVDKEDGLLNYIQVSTANAASTDEVVYNKVTVPNGGNVVDLQLADGSKVWLNTGSTIWYPVNFNEDERKVEITGEAYFEVANSFKGKVTPFIVRKDDMIVTVLGTKFNVNTYDNEEDIKVTLLEGSGKVQFKQSESIVKSGEQAICNNSGISVTNNIDLGQMIAWKKGKFEFNGTNIQPIMRQMERWYDLDITQYENEAVKEWNFNGEISRYNKASDVLKLLEETGAVKFAIKENKIIVKK